MDCFEINKYQEGILRTNAHGSKYIIIVPDVSKDSEELCIGLKEHQLWTEQLVGEGLMEEVSTVGDQFIEQMTQRDGRTYRMFKLTEMAQVMFSPVLVQGVEHGSFRNVVDTIH